MKLLIRRLLERLHPQLFADRSDLIRAAKEIGDKLKEARREKEEWRQRAFSAENQLRDIFRAMDDGIQVHTNKTGAVISRW